VPSKSGLLLQEEDLGDGTIGSKLLACSKGIMGGNSNGQTRGAETNADEIKLGIQRRSLKERRALTVDARAIS
jgi:hypothetical protein